MNRKITVRTHRGDLRSFILDPAQDIPQQLATVHRGQIGHGITYQMTETEIQTIDYFCGEVMFAHKILSVEDTREPVSLKWTTIDE